MNLSKTNTDNERVIHFCNANEGAHQLATLRSSCRFTIAILFVAVNTVFGAHGIWAQESITPPIGSALAVFDFSNDPRWVEKIELAQKNLERNLLPSIDATKKKLEADLASLDSFLRTSTAHGDNWKSFLRLNLLREELAKESPNLEVLQDLEKSFRQNYVGLEMSQFVNLRESLASFAHAQRFSGKPETTLELLNNRLKRLIERVKTPGVLADGDGMHEVAQTIAYLSHGHQAPELVREIRSKFSHPNARVIVSSEFLQRKFARPVNQPSPVNEEILGTTIVGNSFLSGFVTPQLIDSPNQALVRLNLNADFSSVNTGYNRSVVLQTQGCATVAACESLAFTESGLVSMGDTGADANLTSTINSIEHPLKIVRKIASKQAAKKKPTADAIGESRLENRIRTQFHEQLSTQLAEANQKLNVADPPELKRLGLSRPTRSSWSTPNFLAILWNMNTGVQLGSSSSCPLSVDPSGITIQLHQSSIGNMLDPVLAGRVIRSEEMDRYVGQFGELAKGIRRKPDENAWSITLQSFQPVDVQFEDGKVIFRVRTSRIDREDSSLTQLATIKAVYHVELVDNKVQLVREGDLQVDFQGNQQRGTKAVTLRSVLKSKFEELFKPELLERPFDLRERLPDQMRDVQIVSITLDEGWMQAHLR